MSTGYWQRTITNDAGDIIANAQIEVREPSADFTGTLVSLVDIDGAGLSNPFNADSEGFARFGTSPQLVDVRATGSGSQRTWRRVEVLGTAATQSDTRYAHRANNLSDLASAGTSRDNLGLGTAAVADTTTSATDTTSGRLLQVGDFGVGGDLEISDHNTSLPSGFYIGGGDLATNFPESNLRYSGIVNATRSGVNYRWMQQGSPSTQHIWCSRVNSDDTQEYAVELYHTGNTIVDSNGFIKEA